MSSSCVQGNPEADSATRQAAETISREIQEEIRKYIRFLPQVPEPNLARVREIKEQIEKGNYLTREVVEETAARLMFRFLRKE